MFVGKTLIVIYALHQTLTSRLNSDSFNFWNVKNMIKTLYELGKTQLFVWVALKRSHISHVAEAII